MFFLGLLSTPMPYLLLAAFYFFGFAMGMFNNKTGDEVAEPLASVTIPAEVKENKADGTVYYFQISPNSQNHIQSEFKKDTSTADIVFDTSPTNYFDYYLKTYEFKFSCSLFCRPPPTVC